MSGRTQRAAIAAAVLVAAWAGATAGGLLEPRTLGIEAHHALHVSENGLACDACHVDAPASKDASELLLPSSRSCEPCHPLAACEGPLGPECRSCHSGKPRSILSERFEHAKRTAIRFDHEAHVDRTVAGCRSCHPLDPGRPDERNPLMPQMQLCIGCHPHDKAWETDTCAPCHIKTKKGTLKLDPGGRLLTPPAWMHGAEHDGAWVLTHAGAAATRPGLCSACHLDTDCAACHAGTVKPESIHPGDWLHFHPVSARLGDLRCSACHTYQEFCITCHRKAGAAWDAPTSQGVPAGDVFHPSGWYVLGGQSKHAVQAKKNLSTCTSCHTEQDCITCHSATSTFSFSPHPPPGQWLDKCKVLAKKNPSTCLKCHASVPAMCR